MTAKTMLWRPDTHDHAFHLAYDSEDPDGTMRCFQAAMGNVGEELDSAGRLLGLTGDTVLADAAAHQLYVSTLADNQAINQAKAAADPSVG